MNNTTETVRDIITEMRYRANRPDFLAPTVLRAYATRLETALSQELALNIISEGGCGDTAPVLCNVAELREAVSDIKMGLTRKMEQLPAYMTSQEVAILTRCRHALSEPPRNCDMFRTWDDAEAEYLRLVDNGKVEDGTWCEWLFATASESEATE